ncbi:hypothetical protein SCA6_013992 [Theobroma cacao]
MTAILPVKLFLPTIIGKAARKAMHRTEGSWRKSFRFDSLIHIFTIESNTRLLKSAHYSWGFILYAPHSSWQDWELIFTIVAISDLPTAFLFGVTLP